jgi:hypothetical protein
LDAVPAPNVGSRFGCRLCARVLRGPSPLLARNVCDKAVFVQFKEEGQGVIERQLGPGEAMLYRRTRGWWVFATCPPGHVGSLVLSQENFDAIRASRYSCVRK